MSGAFDTLKEIITLTSNVSDLKSNVERIDNIMRDHESRITRLEAREEVIIEKCKNSALMAVNQISNGLTEKLTELNCRFKQLAP